MKHPEIEKALEDRCVARIEALGGMALKLAIRGVRGFPDRMVLAPGMPVWCAEFKRLRSGRVSAQQVEWQRRLRAVGVEVRFIDTDAAFVAAIEAARCVTSRS